MDGIGKEINEERERRRIKGGEDIKRRKSKYLFYWKGRI